PWRRWPSPWPCCWYSPTAPIWPACAPATKTASRRRACCGGAEKPATRRMNPGLYQLYACLADGRLHSGATLSEGLGISRAAVWKRVQALRAIGLEIPATAGGGYRLERPIELLDADDIRSQASAAEL